MHNKTLTLDYRRVEPCMIELVYTKIKFPCYTIYIKSKIVLIFHMHGMQFINNWILIALCIFVKCLLFCGNKFCRDRCRKQSNRFGISYLGIYAFDIHYGIGF